MSAFSAAFRRTCSRQTGGEAPVYKGRREERGGIYLGDGCRAVERKLIKNEQRESL